MKHWVICLLFPVLMLTASPLASPDDSTALDAPPTPAEQAELNKISTLLTKAQNLMKDEISNATKAILRKYKNVTSDYEAILTSANHLRKLFKKAVSKFIHLASRNIPSGDRFYELKKPVEELVHRIDEAVLPLAIQLDQLSPAKWFLVRSLSPTNGISAVVAQVEHYTRLDEKNRFLTVQFFYDAAANESDNLLAQLTPFQWNKYVSVEYFPVGDGKNLSRNLIHNCVRLDAPNRMKVLHCLESGNRLQLCLNVDAEDQKYYDMCVTSPLPVMIRKAKAQFEKVKSLPWILVDSKKWSTANMNQYKQNITAALCDLLGEDKCNYHNRGQKMGKIPTGEF